MKDLHYVMSREFYFAFLLFLSSILLSCSKTTAENQNSESTKQAQKETVQQVKVYYFHTSYRCNTCTRIEQLTKEAILDTFSTEIKEKRLALEVYDIEVKENEPYIKKYKLITKSVIVSRLIDGQEKKWKNLDKIWTLHGNPEKFKQYIVNEIKQFIES